MKVQHAGLQCFVAKGTNTAQMQRCFDSFQPMCCHWIKSFQNISTTETENTGPNTYLCLLPLMGCRPSAWDFQSTRSLAFFSICNQLYPILSSPPGIFGPASSRFQVRALSGDVRCCFLSACPIQFHLLCPISSIAGIFGASLPSSPHLWSCLASKFSGFFLDSCWWRFALYWLLFSLFSRSRLDSRSLEGSYFGYFFDLSGALL